eukprot:s257_g11.t1
MLRLHFLEVFAVEGNSWAAARAACLTPDTVQAGGARGVGECGSGLNRTWKAVQQLFYCRLSPMATHLLSAFRSLQVFQNSYNLKNSLKNPTCLSPPRRAWYAVCVEYVWLVWTCF